MLKPYLQLMRLHKPIGILLLLWPTLWALWLGARGLPNLITLSVFILGVVIMRSAGCVINDIADRHFDGHVQRTRTRPLVTGAVSIKQALILFAGLCCCAALLLLFLNRFTQYLSIAALALAIVYPFTKRLTYWPQLVLGAAFGWAVPMAYAAQLNTLPTSAWWVFAAAVLWPLAYDTMYAMVDREDDRQLPIKSTALLFEKYDRLFIGIIQVLTLGCLVIAGLVEHLRHWYYIGLAAAALLAVYQQYLIKDQIPANCFRAFLNNNGFGLAIFAALALDFSLK